MACNPLFNSKKSVFFTNYELAVIKNVVISVRSSKVSYHKIAKSFKLSSRTVYNWVNKISCFSRKIIHVNINDIANALYSRIIAYRKGWIQKIDISKILIGDGIH